MVARTVEKTTKPRSQAQKASPMVSPAPAQLLTAAQLMEMLSISRVKLHYMMRRDGLPYIKLGEGRAAAVRFSLSAVQQWLADNTVNAQPVSTR